MSSEKIKSGRLMSGTALLIVLLAAAGCSIASSAPKRPQPPAVEVASVVQKDVPVYHEWIGTQLNALDADRDLFQAELQLAQIQPDESLTVVQLYKALGGGWQ